MGASREYRKQNIESRITSGSSPILFSIFKFLVSVLLASSFSILVSAPSAHAATLTLPPNHTGLVGYWPLNEGTGSNTVDASGNGNAGTITGATWVDGKFGRALSFDGDDSVNLGTGSSLQINTEISAGAWIYQTGEGTSYDWVFDHGRSADGSWGITVHASSDEIWVFRNGGSLYFDSNVTNTKNQWTHVFFTKDSSDNLILYKNGEQAASTTGFTINSATGLTSRIAAWGSTHLFHGTIDDVRVYNRVLTAEEVKRIYRAGSATRSSMNTTGLVGWWRFNEGSGSTTRDDSNKGNTGTITGATWTTAGKFGNALSFDGNDVISIADNGSADIGSSGKFTVMAWVYPTSLAGNDRGIVCKTSLLSSAGVDFCLADMAGGAAKWEIYGAGYRFSSSTQQANVWTHVVGQYDGTQLNMYVNGVLDNGTTNSGAKAAANNADIEIGSWFSTRFFPGKIDDVRIYNRALSADEISKIYNDTSSSRITKVSTSPVTALTDGLVGYWTFDGPDLNTTTSTDRSGNGNNGTLSGGPQPTSGIFGQALKFDGSNDYVDIADSANYDGGTTLTVSAWIRPTDAGENQTIATKWDHSTQTSWAFQTSFSSGANDLQVFIAESTTSGGGRSGYTSDNSLIAGAWQHVVFVYDGSLGASDRLKIYVNAVSKSLTLAGTIPTSLPNSSATLKIGKFGGSLTRYFNGSIDDVRIYNRALSASEVLQLYNMGR